MRYSEDNIDKNTLNRLYALPSNGFVVNYLLMNYPGADIQIILEDGSLVLSRVNYQGIPKKVLPTFDTSFQMYKAFENLQQI